MNQLDLHGIKHQDVQILVEDWVLVHQTEIPLRIICGNSAKMIQLVDEVLQAPSLLLIFEHLDV